MSFVNHKDEVAALLDSPVFLMLLGVRSREQFQQIPQTDAANLGQYYENPWDEDDQTAGVKLLTTGTPGFYGSAVYVAKLYGEVEKPFRVVWREIVPWGTEMDPELTVGDFKTVGEAISMMLETSLKGQVELNVIQESETTGHYVKGEAAVSLPEPPKVSKAERMLHSLLSVAQEASEAEWARDPEPVAEENGFEVPAVTRRQRPEDTGPSF
jgi:hypothetical protein